MTKPLAQTNRDLLQDLHGRLPSIESTLTALLGQRREQLHELEKLTATNKLLAGYIDRLRQENETLMRMLGRMTTERLRGQDERIQFDPVTDEITLCGVKYSLGVFERLGVAPIGETFRIVKRTEAGELWLTIERAPLFPPTDLIERLSAPLHPGNAPGCVYGDIYVSGLCRDAIAEIQRLTEVAKAEADMRIGTFETIERLTREREELKVAATEVLRDTLFTNGKQIDELQQQVEQLKAEIERNKPTCYLPCEKHAGMAPRKVVVPLGAPMKWVCALCEPAS